MLHNHRFGENAWAKTQSFEIALPSQGPKMSKNLSSDSSLLNHHFPSIARLKKITTTQKKSLNSSQRKLVTNLSKIFISQMKPKPSKIFVRLNEMPQDQSTPQEECSISKIQISRAVSGETLSKNNVCYESDVDMPTMFSFRHVPEIQKITVRTLGAEKKVESDIQIQQNQSLIEKEQEESGIRGKGSQGFKISQQVGLGYVPSKKTTKDSRIHFPSQMSPTSDSGIYPSLREKMTTTYYPQDDLEDYTNLVGLGFFSKQKDLRDKIEDEEKQMHQLLEKNYASLQQKKRKQIEQLKKQLQKVQEKMTLKNKEIEQLGLKNNKLIKQLSQLNQKMNQAKRINQDHIRKQNQQDKKLKDIKICVKELREELIIKDNYIRQNMNYDGKNKDKDHQSGHNPQDSSVSARTVPLKIDYNDLSHAISRAVSDRTLGANHQPCPIIILNQPAPQQKQHSTFRQTLNHISSPKIRNNIHKNRQSPQSTPNISTVRSCKSSEHFINGSQINSRDNSQSHSNMSNFSALHKIGFMKKNNEKRQSGTLLDFMKSQQKISPKKDAKKPLKVTCLKKQ